MRHNLATAIVALLGLACSSGASQAMTSTTPPDGNGHPAAVALLRSDGYWARPFCSGMLLSDKVVATASHCLEFAVRLQQAGWQLAVTNDATLQQDSGGWLQISTLTTNAPFGQIVLNPAYDPKVLGGYDHDVSAVVLSTPVSVDPAAFPTLPTMGLLDELKASGYLRDSTFSVLGYGIVEKPTPAHGKWVSTFSGERRIGTLGFFALDKRFIHESQRLHQGQDGACNGDSGGPSLLQIGSTTYLVGVTSAGDIPCYATNTATRTDTDDALALLMEVLDENP
ncbi:MAG TPA: trypsin-like serine protease [Rudaea sp.]|nr:trypsin-like serine protease [Rudaea sp.]